MSGLIWVQYVCKGYEQATLVVNELNIDFPLLKQRCYFFACWVIFHVFFCCLLIFFKINFFEKLFQESNIFDPDQDRHSHS